MINREELFQKAIEESSAGRLFDPDASELDQQFINGETDLLRGQVPPELRSFPTQTHSPSELTTVLGSESDYFADPYMPDRVLRSITPTDALDAGEWLLSKGYRMVEGAVVLEEQTGWTVGRLAMTELTSGRGLIKKMLGHSAVVGPYITVAEDRYNYTPNGVGLWFSEARREKLRHHS